MKFISLLTIIVFGSFGVLGQNCDDLFISGYLEGSSYDKAIEIYNPTANSISLNNYKIRVYTNANTSIGQEFSFASVASIGANQTYVVAHGSANASLSSDEDYGWQFNGNDAVALYNCSSNIDLI